MLADFDPFCVRGPLAERAQALMLVQPEQPSGRVWFASATTADLAGLKPEAFLDAAELAQLATFRFAPRRENFLLGHLAAKIALAAFLAESEWSKIGLTNGVLGQPLVRHHRSAEAEISLSHAGELAVALAFPRGQSMGLDVELIDESRADTVKKELLFRPEEQQWMAAHPVPEPSAYVLLWTVREALGKAMRCGLTCPLELLAVDQITRRADGVWESRYHNFHQYRCLSWMQDRRILSLTLPRTSELTGVSRQPARGHGKGDGERPTNQLAPDAGS